MRGKILLIEDEDDLRMVLGDRLRKEGCIVACAADGEEGHRMATELPFDLIILDLMLPKKNGLIVCEEIRKAGLTTPVLMVTARSQTSDMVTGLKIGADDYLTKPFNMDELAARVEALLRRGPNPFVPSTSVFDFGSVRVDLAAAKVTRDRQFVNLSIREFQLLRYFLEHPGTTLSREELLERVWGYRIGIFSRTVDMYVAKLRKKLEADPTRPQFFLTVEKLGYKFKT